MTDVAFEAMKAACARVIAGPAKGTAYLVDAQHAITCAHVVKPVGPAGAVDVHFPSTSVKATVGSVDWEADAAVLKLAIPLNGIAPLRLAGTVARKAPWEGYGFPGIAKGQSLPLEGAVMDPDSKDDQNVPVLLLKSDQLAAGQGAALHGFSGSPILVQGFVVGHLKRYIKDNESPLRPAFGYVYATPSAAVLKLLGARAALTVVEPPLPLFPTQQLAARRDEGYDVFISYGSTDRSWANDLFKRLEGVGFKVFIDQRELLPGQALASGLQTALGRCKSAVVLISKAWSQSACCLEEGNVLLKRAIENPDFHLVPVRLDESPLAPMWDSRAWLNFSKSPSPEGHEFRRLQFALIGKPAPADDAPEVRVFKAESEATDELIAALQAAAAGGPNRVYKLWETWRTNKMPDGPAHLFASEILIRLGDLERALEILELAKPGNRADQLRALALGKLGRIDEAIEILKRLYNANRTALDSETGGILGGRYKQRWITSGCSNKADLRASFETYLETYERTSAPYTGVNASAMALEMGNKVESSRIARKVLMTLKDVDVEKLDHWNRATLAEVYLLLNDVKNARKWYGKAVGYEPEMHQDIAVMRGQARRILVRLGHARDAFDEILYIPRVAAFAGHMVDAPSRTTPRFPEDKVGTVRKAIVERLNKYGIGYGFSSGARGSDLLFVEELKKRGACACIYLPFPRSDFKKTSVDYGWDTRFDQALLGDNVDVVELSPEVPAEPEQAAAYGACVEKILEAAVKKAQLLDQEPILITVWDGDPGDGAGGTENAVRAWKLEGYELDTIDISTL